jgi:hypothetical protein
MKFSFTRKILTYINIGLEACTNSLVFKLYIKDFKLVGSRLVFKVLRSAMMSILL